jgi:hypothetical protein
MTFVRLDMYFGVINEKGLRKNQLLSYELYSWVKNPSHNTVTSI